MSWIEKLARTYDLNDGQKGLTPIFHTGLNAHVIVTIDEDGAFVDARVIQDKDREKIVPCTEGSLSQRSSTAVKPHALSDSLMYIGGDFPECAKERYSQKKRERCCENYQAYMKQLEGWATWSGADPAVKAVHTYLRKKTICRDLIGKGILPVWQDGSMFVTRSAKGSLTE
jgi:CRISPR-associated protein Csd1